MDEVAPEVLHETVLLQHCCHGAGCAHGFCRREVCTGEQVDVEADEVAKGIQLVVPEALAIDSRNTQCGAYADDY